MSELSFKLEDRYDSLFGYYASKVGLDWRMLKAQCITESNLNPNAISPVGAKGLAQFMPPTFAEWWDKTWGLKGIPKGDPSNPEISISLQAAYMRALMDAFKDDYRAALAAYNWGWGRVKTHMKTYGALTLDKLPQETSDYILRYDRNYRRLTGVGIER